MTIYWPEHLGRPLIEGYSKQRQSDVVSFQPDIGAPITRRRSTVAVFNSTFRFYFNQSQLESFEFFFDVTIGGGALEFQMINPISNKPMRLKIASGDYSMTAIANDVFTIDFQATELRT